MTQVDWAQKLDEIKAREQTKQMLVYFRDHFDEVVDDITAICEVPSPSFHERKRAEHVSVRMKQVGLADVHIDEHNNVIGRYAGEDHTARLAVLTHIDTVFPDTVDVTVKHEGDRLLAPGIGDNATSVGSVLHMFAAWKDAGYTPPFDVVFVGNACEEGLGDLKGAKGFVDGYAARDDVELAAMLVVDGVMNNVTNAGIGSRRLKVNVHAEGGHSWNNFGNASAIHALGAAIGKIADIEVPDDPRTSFNVGVIEGGTSVNTIAEQAMMLIDMRSEALNPLKKVEAEVRAVIEEQCTRYGATYDIEVVGDRPVGQIPDHHPLVEIARAAGAEFGFDMPTRAASTDANVPLSRDIPAIGVGVYLGAEEHTTREWMKPETLREGFPAGLFILLGTVEWISML